VIFRCLLLIFFASRTVTMAVTFGRCSGHLMRFGLQRFAVVASNVVSRNYLHTSLSVLNVQGSRALFPFTTGSFTRNFSSAQPCPQKETYVSPYIPRRGMSTQLNSTSIYGRRCFNTCVHRCSLSWVESKILNSLRRLSNIFGWVSRTRATNHRRILTRDVQNG